MSFSLRRATFDDLARLLALERRSFDRPWPAGAFEQELSLPQSEVWLAAADGLPDRAVGYVIFWIVGPEVNLLNVAVDPDHRRQGLARKLLHTVQDRAQDVDAEAIFLEVRRGNQGARTLYSQEGYEQVGIRKRYYSDNREDAIVMAKSISGTGSEAGGSKG